MDKETSEMRWIVRAAMIVVCLFGAHCVQFAWYGGRDFPHGPDRGTRNIPGDTLAAAADVSIAGLAIKGGAAGAGGAYGLVAIIIWVSSLVENIRAEKAGPQCIEGDCMNGQGVQQSLCVYSGNFQAGRYSGAGTLRCSDWEYSGFWKEGEFAIRGKLTRADQIYEGPIAGTGQICFQADCTNGKAAWAYYGGSIYVGEFRNGKPHGQGKYTAPGDREYEGNWIEGEQHGHGAETVFDAKTGQPSFRHEGEWISGRWFRGRIIDLRTGEITNENGR